MKWPNIFSKTDEAKEVKSGLTLVSIDDSKPLFTRDVNPSNISSAVSQMKRLGKLNAINNIYETLWDGDATLAGNIDTRAESLKSKMPTLKGDLSDNELKYYNDVLEYLYPDLVDTLIESKMKKFAFRQVEYELKEGLYFPKTLMEYQNLDLRAVKNELVLFQDDKQKNLSELKFIALLKKRAILQPLMKYYVFKSFAINNWASFTEIFGKPVRVGKYKPGATKTEKDELWEMLQNAGSDLAMMVSENIVMEFVDHNNKSASSDLYNNLMKFCEDATTKRILGQTLTTNAEPTGSFAQAKVHNMVRRDILAGDARDLIIMINDLFTKLSVINFDGKKIHVIMDLTDDVNLFERVQIDRTLQNDIGIIFPDDYFYDTYKIPKPE